MAPGLPRAAAAVALGLLADRARGAQSWRLAADPLMAIGNPQVGFHVSCRKTKLLGNCQYPPELAYGGPCTSCRGGRGGCASCADPPMTMPEWADDTVEHLTLNYKDLCPTGPDACTGLDGLNQSLSWIAKRGRQAVLAVVLAASGQEINNTAPQWMLSAGLKSCTYYDGEWLGAQPDWNDEVLLSAFEKLIEQLARFDGDSRLLWMHAGLLGSSGSWRLSKNGRLAISRCEFSTTANQRRIVVAYRTHFKNTFVLFPEPERMGGVDLSTAPNFGFHDWDFGASTFAGRNVSHVMAQDPVRAERWRTAPVSGAISRHLRRCWWASADAARECEAAGAMRDPPTYYEAAASYHTTVLWSNSWTLFTPRTGSRTKQETEAMDRIKDAYAAAGPRYYLREVAIEPITAGKLRVCVAAENTGSARFYSPASMPMELRLTVGALSAAMQQAGGEGFAELGPSDGERVFTAETAWAELDECKTHGSACTAAGQTCEDPVQTAASQGDWECVCGAPTSARQRGKAAVCKPITFLKEELIEFNQVQTDKDVVPLKTAQELGLVGASFTLGFRLYIALTNGRSPNPKGIRDDPTSYAAGSGDRMTIFGVDNGRNYGTAFVVQFDYQAIHWMFSFTGCRKDMGIWKDANDANWAHVTLVYDAGAEKMRMYKDGEKQLECDQAPYKGIAGQMINIGARQRDHANQLRKTQDKKGELFFGKLKDIVFYGDKLTDTEVRTLAQPAADLQLSPKVELELVTEFKQREIYFATSDKRQLMSQAKSGSGPAVCCGCLSCYRYFRANQEWCEDHRQYYDPAKFDKECGQAADCGACGRVLFPMPPESAAPSTDSCFAPPPTPGPTPAPTPAPTANTFGCGELELKGFNLTVPGVTHTDPKCDGTYESIGSGHWRKVPDGERDLWRASDDTYRCVLRGLGPNGTHFGNVDKSWWAARLTCKAARTPAPTPAPTPLPPGTTAAPETPAPATPSPETPAPATVAPPTAAPDTPAPPTDAPATPAPGTPAPATPAPFTFAPPTPAPTPAPTPVPPTPAPTPLPPGNTVDPSMQPSSSPPSEGPISPTRSPLGVTAQPISPSGAPLSPSAAPLPPSRAPIWPTAAPQVPSTAPSSWPSVASFSPSVEPSHSGDTSHPSVAPVTAAPSGGPSAPPSASPGAPSAAPSASPEAVPVAAPSAAPAKTPSASPSHAPSGPPSAPPSLSAPSIAPQQQPTAAPFTAGEPSASPVESTAAPSATTGNPSAAPSGGPSPGPSGGGTPPMDGASHAPAGSNAPDPSAGNATAWSSPSGAPSGEQFNFSNLSPYQEDLVLRGAAGADGDAGSSSTGIPWWFWVLLVMSLVMLGLCIAAWVRWCRRRKARMQRKRGDGEGWNSGGSPTFSNLQRPSVCSAPEELSPPGSPSARKQSEPFLAAPAVLPAARMHSGPLPKAEGAAPRPITREHSAPVTSPRSVRPMPSGPLPPAATSPRQVRKPVAPGQTSPTGTRRPSDGLRQHSGGLRQASGGILPPATRRPSGQPRGPSDTMESAGSSGARRLPGLPPSSPSLVSRQPTNLTAVSSNPDSPAAGRGKAPKGGRVFSL
eukprot:TRINITY_DN49947_c0_g1_i1.p1 TRINITY_DN49947_c0_g1~~TRINITY_DN49947_c0_g1_i1.p1  ORF type:complete len:1604 (+),score=335.63 TRINITY_DN49947_c0_g1_i1:86-4813(+)